jgi:prefoldin subunit 5
LAAALAALTAQVQQLQATVQHLAAENAELRVTLALAAFGDKAQRTEVLGQAARMLVRPANGNGANGHD